MAKGRRTLEKFTLYSEELLNDKVTRFFILLLHLIAFLLGFSGAIIGVVSLTNDSDSPSPQTNCTLSTNTENADGADIRLSLLLLLTGFALVFTDIAITSLMCVIKWQSCGVLAIVWFLITVAGVFIWTCLSIAHVSIVTPIWMDSKETCDYLVVVWALASVTYCGILTVAYVAVIVVVVSYDCNRWINLRGLD